MKPKILITVPIWNDLSRIKNIIESIDNVENASFLLVDDGSTDETFGVLKENKNIQFIRHETSLGFGASLISSIEYASNLEYDYLITLDPDSKKITEDINLMIENLKYGFEIVSCSRILENFEIEKIDDSLTTIVQSISVALKNVTNLDITDPLSGIKAFDIKSLKKMELTEFDHAVLLQMWIQAAFFDFSVIEIPSESDTPFALELEEYEDPEGYLLSVIETEKYLYQKGTIN